MRKLLSFSPWIGVTAFIVVAVILGAFSQCFLDVSLWGSHQQYEVLTRVPSKGPGKPPVFAYWISGTGGESKKMMRLVKAVYHPRNRYLLHLDAASAAEERIRLARSVQSERLFKAFGNVDVVGKTYVVDPTGASAVAAVLHGAAVLLRICQDWDWFITLSASDYPLVTQDGKSFLFFEILMACIYV